MQEQVQIYVFVGLLVVIILAIDWYLGYRIKRTMRHWNAERGNRRRVTSTATRPSLARHIRGASSITEFISMHPWAAVGVLAFVSCAITIVISMVEMVRSEQVVHHEAEKAKYYSVCRERRLAAIRGSLHWLDQ